MRYLFFTLIIVLFGGCNDKNTENQINSLETLKSFMEDGQKNGHFPKEIVTGMPISPNKLQPVDIENSTIITWTMNSKCEGSGKKVILALGDENHSIVCYNGDAVYIAGNGNDWIDDAVGNDIYYGGKGDDTIENSWGSDIFIFEQNWGHDTITFSPGVVDTSKIIGYDGSYPWKYTSFIVFGKGINRSDIHWEEDSLVNSKTGDSIKLNSKKINIIFASEGSSKLIDKNFIPIKKVPKKISIEQIKGKSLTIKNNIAFVADRGLVIVDLKDIKNPTILSETHHLPGVATSVNIVDNIAYVTQAAPYFSEGAGGWVSIIDISDLQNPEILSTLNFGNNIFNIALNGKYLYVADTNFSYGDKRSLSIFDISTPNEPKLLSKTKLKYYSRFMAYANDLLFLSTFKSKITVLDVKNPQEPQEFAQNFSFGGKVLGIKSSNDKIIINQDGNTVSILETTKNQKITHQCDVKTAGTNYYGSNSASAMAIDNNLLYEAEYRDGVSIIDIKNCTLEKAVPLGGVSISSVGVIDHTIFAMNEDTTIMYDLSNQQKNELNSTVDEPYSKLSKDQLQTMLYQAAQDDKAEEVIELCKAGANPNFAGHERHTPLQISARLGKLKSLEALLQNGAIADEESMMLAALREQIDAMKILEKFGGNIAQTDKDGCTTLHYIAQDGTVEMVKYLVEKGVPINATCRGKETALKWANSGNNIEVIQYLESKGVQ